VIVVDANVVVNAVIRGHMSAAAVEVRRKDARWRAPRLWRYEFTNVLWKHLRAGTLGLDLAARYVAAADVLMREAASEPSALHVLRLAEQSGCTAYDCQYVALAAQLGVRLVTGDRQVLRAFPDLAVHPVDFAGQG
jgi:predicted nucleic acid-binding protein